MGGTNPNEALEMASQIKQIVVQGNSPLSSLQELLQMVNQQLMSYEDALEILSNVDPQTWTYDQAGKIIESASGRTDRSLSPSEWNLMLPDAREQLHTNYSTTYEEAKQAFAEVKDLVLAEIDRRKKEELPAAAASSAAEKRGPVEKGEAASATRASITSEIPRSTAETAKSKRKWGCVLATCGSFILAIGLIIIAAIIYSLFDPDSGGDDPIVVLGRTVICVLPIFGVGLGLLVFGISKLRSQKKKPAAKQFGGNRFKTEKKTRVQAVVDAELINEGNYLDKMNNEEMIDKEDITDLIDALDSPKNYSARNALWNQHKQGDPKVKEALISAMSHKSSKVRAQSIQLLKEPSIGLKDLNVLNLLIQALQDESADVRYESAYALADIRSAKATRPLMELLDDESEPVREYVVYALGEISDPQAADALMKRVPNETERVRMRIGHALKKIKAVWG